MNLEFLVIDKRTFLTDTDHALRALFGDTFHDAQDQFNAEIRRISSRLATALASLKVIPFMIRYLLHTLQVTDLFSMLLVPAIRIEWGE